MSEPDKNEKPPMIKEFIVGPEKAALLLQSELGALMSSIVNDEEFRNEDPNKLAQAIVEKLQEVEVNELEELIVDSRQAES